MFLESMSHFTFSGSKRTVYVRNVRRCRGPVRDQPVYRNYKSGAWWSGPRQGNKQSLHTHGMCASDTFASSRLELIMLFF